MRALSENVNWINMYPDKCQNIKYVCWKGSLQDILAKYRCNRNFYFCVYVTKNFFTYFELCRLAINRYFYIIIIESVFRYIEV